MSSFVVPNYKKKYEEKVTEYSLLQKQLSEVNDTNVRIHIALNDANSAKDIGVVAEKEEKEISPDKIDQVNEIKSSPTNWLTMVSNQSVREDFQAFIAQLHSFSEEFRKVKYASCFNRMAHPCAFFLSQILGESPPEDVLVAQLSGIIKTALSEIRAKKSGRKKHQEFLKMSQRTSSALQKFINSTQSAIRIYKSKAEERTSVNTAIIPNKGSQRVIMRTSLIALESVDVLNKKIADLRRPPSPPTCFDHIERILIKSTGYVLVALLSYGLAAGAWGCTGFHHIEEPMIWNALPCSLILFGSTLFCCAYCKTKPEGFTGCCGITSSGAYTQHSNGREDIEEY